MQTLLKNSQELVNQINQIESRLIQRMNEMQTNLNFQQPEGKLILIPYLKCL